MQLLSTILPHDQRLKQALADHSLASSPCMDLARTRIMLGSGNRKITHRDTLSTPGSIQLVRGIATKKVAWRPNTLSDMAFNYDSG